MPLTYFSIGTNLGDRQQNIKQAITLMEKRVGQCIRCSTFYATAPWGFESENEFLNAAAAFSTDLPPLELLTVTQQIEREMGRIRKSNGSHYADRLIDIDILLYGDETIDLPELKIPHPLMYKRDFVITPLAEIAPEKIRQ